MDKLISYIEQRIKKYGHVKGDQAISSNYYTFGNTVVRVSDHIKYGETGVKKFDYCFIIQPDETYIFTASPKIENGQTCRMYLKIVSLKDAKDFIRRLHDFSISFDFMTETYSPEGWNRGVASGVKKIPWDDFYNTHLKNLDDKVKLNILDMIECVVYGGISKGNLEVKLDRAPKVYENASIIQYDTILNKIEKKCGQSK